VEVLELEEELELLELEELDVLLLEVVEEEVVLELVVEGRHSTQQTSYSLFGVQSLDGQY
jgi:hypothetical protein